MKHENDLKIEELDRILKLFPRNIILILSILETCCAFLSVISRHYFLGDGIWTGPIFVIASLIGFLSWFNPSKLRIQAFIALSMVATLLSVSLSMLSIWNNLSIVCLQIFVGFHSGIVGLAIFAYLCRILDTDDGQQGIILKKDGNNFFKAFAEAKVHISFLMMVALLLIILLYENEFEPVYENKDEIQT